MQLYAVLMIGALLSSFSTLSLAYELSDEQRATAAKLAAAAREDTHGYDVVRSLTTEVGPRLAGTEAEARARQWAKAALERAGFDRVEIQPFSLPVWQRKFESAEVRSPYPQPLQITALGSSPSTPPGGVTGEVVPFDSLARLQAAEDGSLKGKIVFVDETMARTQDGSGYGLAVAKRRATGYEAQRKGAAAALIRSVGTSSNRFPHTGLMQRVDAVDSGVSAPTAALSAPDADQLQRMMDRSEAPVTVQVTLQTEVIEGGTSGNVIAEWTGSERPREVVLVGAHLDSWDLGTGAVDDGAGVGIVLGAVNLVQKTLGRRLKRTVRVVLFGAEEVGLRGAEFYTKAFSEAQQQAQPEHRETIILAAESDFGAGPIWRMGFANVGESYAEAADALARHFTAMNIVTQPRAQVTGGGPDTYYLHELGVPIGALTQDGSDYFDLHHTANDTFDKVSLEGMRQSMAVYAQLIYLLADSDIRLRD